jgi:cupin fold WbuC family metalloprotein
MTRIINHALLDQAVAAAQDSPRGRRNLNFHPADDYPAHRLLNAVEPGSYVAPHRHLDPSKDETMLCLRGRLGVVLFNDDGSIRQRLILSPTGPDLGVDIPHGTYHTILALEPGTVFFEAKAGPYTPLTPEEKAPWAPAENGEGAEGFYRKLMVDINERLFVD